MRFPSGWRRQLGREACAYAQEFFGGGTELAGQGGKLNASGVMLLVSSLVSEVRLLQREQEAARQEGKQRNLVSKHYVSKQGRCSKWRNLTAC